MTISDWIQAGLALLTFLAVIVALFGARFWRWRDRPRLEIDFTKDSDRNFRWADVPSCNIQDEGPFNNVKKYYFRLRIKNNGGAAKNLRVRVELFDETKHEAERFEPSTLLWINARETVDLAKGESEYVNFLSQVVRPNSISRRLTIELFDASPRGIAWDRVLNVYFFEVTVYGDNTKPKKVALKFTPKTDPNTPGELEVL